MKFENFFYRASVITLCLAFSSIASAGSMTYTGSASTTSTQVEMPLANGGTVITANATGVAAMNSKSVPNPILFGLRCSGLGMVEGESGGAIEFYCTFMENDVDQFDIKGTEHAGETKITVIGGSGRWEKATGSGTLKRTATSVNSSRSTFDLTIITP